MNGDDDFVTITAKHRKKQHAANGDVKGAADSKPPPPPAANASVSAGSSASPPPAAADSISLRPRTMFAMKGRGRAEAEGSAYRPQWSKDGEGFVTAGAAAAKDVHHDAQGAADAARRKAKVIRYTKEELLALHFTTTAPPEFPPETMVASELALPPVTTLPFDYEEIYEQWKLNRNRGGRGRGRGTSAQAEGGGGGGGGQQQQQQSDRSRSNGRWGEDDKWDKPATRRDADGHQQGGGDDTWQRGARPSASRHRDDIWDNVGDGSGESNEMDLSSMAEAAEKFRLEMDALRLELNAPVAVDLKENNGDLDEFDKKLEVAAAAGQFEDSDEEDAQWDEPTDVGAGGGGGGSLGDHADHHGSLFFDHATSSAESQFGLLESKQAAVGGGSSSSHSGDSGYSLQQQQQQQQSLHHAVAEPLLTLEPLRMEVVDEWFYLDPQGNQQGPFKSVEMREWFEAGYFKPHLPIRFGGDGQFTALASHFVVGQTPFAAPLPQPSPSIGASESDRQRLFALQQQEAQRQEQQRQEQQLLQLQQQQQEHQRMLQEEKIRMEMQKLEIARQQQQHQSHLYQQQLLQHQQHQLLQQQQQQQQHMLLQQQTSWQRSQREGIMSALGIFGGEQDRGIPTTEGFHNVMQPQFQSEFRTQHHLGAHDPALRDALFLNDGGARQQNEFWGQGAAAAAGTPAPTPASAFAPQQQNRSPQPQEKVQSQQQQQQTSAPADLPWGRSTSESESASSSSLHQIQNEEKRKAADSVRQSPAKAAPRVAPTAPTSKPQQQPQPQQQAPAAPAAAPATSNATKKAQKPKAKAAAATAAAPTEAAKAVWVDPSAAPTKSLQQIQQEEQRELRRRMDDTVGGANLEQMGAQLKMMLGVQPSTASGAGSGASPWGVPPATAQPTQAAKQQSLRDILAEEERLAQERAKQSQSTSSAGSHWVNVVAGTTPAPAPKPSRALGPVPVSVLKSRPQVRATNGAEPSAAGGAKPVGGPTPPKSESDASFWNFGAAQTAKAAANASSLLSSSSSSSLLSSGGATMSNAFGGSAGVSSEFMAWAAKQYQLISGRDDLTLVEYCVSLEDPGEIREYLAAYLGSTPRVSAFATEFIQRKKGPSLSGAALKRSPSSSSKVSTDDDTAAGGAKKSGGKRRGGKGQKIDPSLLNFA